MMSFLESFGGIIPTMSSRRTGASLNFCEILRLQFLALCGAVRSCIVISVSEIRMRSTRFLLGVCLAFAPIVSTAQESQQVMVLHAARLLQVDTGNVIQPGEVLVEGNRIKAVETSDKQPTRTKENDLGSATLMPGLIDAH